MLLGDTWALARAGDRTVADLLTLASGLGFEVEPATWEIVDQMFDFLSRSVSEAEPPAPTRIASLLGRCSRTSGGSNATGRTNVHGRASMLIRRLGTTGADADVRAEATARFEAGVLEGDLATRSSRSWRP